MMLRQNKNQKDEQYQRLSKIVEKITKKSKTKDKIQQQQNKKLIKKTQIKSKKNQQKQTQKKELLNSIHQNAMKSDDSQDQKLFDNVHLEDQNKLDQKIQIKIQKSKQKQKTKKVTFNEVVDVRFDDDKKWDTKIQNEKQGKFSPQQQQILKKSIVKYCRSKNFTEKQFQDNILNTTNEIRHMKMWTTICSVLPHRSINSCFKFIKRKYNPNNYQGKWTKQEEQKLIQLVEEYGRKWVKISRQIGRTAENVRDKYVSLGQQNLQTRQKQFWKLQQLISLLKGVQSQKKKKFLNKDIQNELQDCVKHNQKQTEQRNKRKKMSANFMFHNLGIVKKYINIKKLRKINIDNIQWSTIAYEIKTRSKQDCRNKWKQIVNIIYQENQNFSHEDDKQLILMIQKQNPDSQYEIDFSILNKKTALQNKIRWNTLKKFISGRIQKSIIQIIKQIKQKIVYKQEQRQHKQKKQPNELLQLYKQSIKQNLNIQS